MPRYRIHARPDAGVVEFTLAGRPANDPCILQGPRDSVDVDLKNDRAAKALEKRLDHRVRVGRIEDRRAAWRAAAKAQGPREHVRVRMRNTLTATIDGKPTEVPNASVHVEVPDGRHIRVMRPDSPPIDVSWSAEQRAALRESGAEAYLELQDLVTGPDGTLVPKRKAKKAAKR